MNVVIRIDAADAFLTSQQTASILGISEGWLRVWRTRGRGPRFLRLGRRGGPIRYRRADVEAFLSTCYARSA